MLFRKKIPLSCEYCSFGTKLDDDTILCIKRGVIGFRKKCGKFQYDPCKRIPPKQKPIDFSRYTSEDFTL